MLESMITQLLTYEGKLGGAFFGLGFCTNEFFNHRQYKTDMDMLLAFLGELIRQLPQNAYFFIAIQMLGCPDKQKDTNDAFGAATLALLDIMGSDRVECRRKLLLTSLRPSTVKKLNDSKTTSMWNISLPNEQEWDEKAWRSSVVRAFVGTPRNCTT